MKKEYVNPETEVLHVSLESGVLGVYGDGPDPIEDED